jgi:hypothetical protein
VGVYSSDEAGIYDFAGDAPLLVYDAENDELHTGLMTSKFITNFISIGEVLNVDVTNSNVGIGTINPTEKLDINGAVKVANNIITDGNVYAKDFITTSKVADSKDGIKALDKISNIGEWLKNGEIQYDKHYAGVEFKKQFVKDIIITYENKERCFEYDSNIIGKIEKVCETKSVKIETPVYDTQIVKGLSMETRVAEMEKMIYELNEKIKVLERKK